MYSEVHAKTKHDVSPMTRMFFRFLENWFLVFEVFFNLFYRRPSKIETSFLLFSTSSLKFCHKNADSAAYYADRADKCAGAFYGGDGAAVGGAVVFILAIVAWVGGMCAILFTTIKFTVGMRVSKEMEVRFFLSCMWVFYRGSSRHRCFKSGIPY